VAILIPVTSLRLQNSDAGNNPTNTSTRQAFDLLAQGFGPGFNGPLSVVVPVSGSQQLASLGSVSRAVAATPDVAAVVPPKLSPSGRIALIRVYPGSAPQDPATTTLVNRLRQQVLPPLKKQLGVSILVGGFTAGSIDFSHVLSSKLPLFIGLVVVLSALLLFVIFRSLVIPLQAAVMNLLSIGGALGATVLVFQKGWLSGVFGLQKGPVEPWVPLLMFAVVFGLSMDYEVFLISRVREEWVRRRDARLAVADGIAFTGRVITAAAAIMICVFLSFFIGNQRTLKEFGFGLATAVFLDAIVVRCVMLPAVLELLGSVTWKLPHWIDRRLPHFRIEGELSPAWVADDEPAPADGDHQAEPQKVAP
jgi:RND superfamily putative drug exporter